MSGSEVGDIPASETAIVAGSKACIGATVDPDGEDGRLAGWQAVPVPPDAHPFGTVLTRDNVLLSVKKGVDGGCFVMAKVDAAFDKTRFLSHLGQIAGVPVDGRQPVNLSNGELMTVQADPAQAGGYVMVIMFNQHSKLFMHSQGN